MISLSLNSKTNKNFHTYTEASEKINEIVPNTAPNMDVAEIKDKIKELRLKVNDVISLKSKKHYRS